MVGLTSVILQSQLKFRNLTTSCTSSNPTSQLTILTTLLQVKVMSTIYMSNTYTTLTLYDFRCLKLLMVSTWITSNRDRAISNPPHLCSWHIGGSYDWDQTDMISIQIFFIFKKTKMPSFKYGPPDLDITSFYMLTAWIGSTGNRGQAIQIHIQTLQFLSNYMNSNQIFIKLPNSTQLIFECKVNNQSTKWYK